jgi:uncharacterized membrane protein
VQIFLPIHVVGAGLALLAGAVALATAKGGRIHRRSGMVFVYAMAAMCGAALLIAAAKTQVTNIIAALLTAYLVVTALIAVRPPSARTRSLAVGSMIFALGVGAMALIVGLQALNSPDRQQFGDPPGPYLLFAVVGLVAGIGDVRAVRAGMPGGVARLARHLWRMCFALWIATASFFLGPRTRVEAVIPEPLLVPALLPAPVLLVLLAMVYWLWRVRRKRRRFVYSGGA